MKNEGVLKVKNPTLMMRSPLDKLDYQFCTWPVGRVAVRWLRLWRDAYKRLLSPSIATEYGTMSKGEGR